MEASSKFFRQPGPTREVVDGGGEGGSGGEEQLSAVRREVIIRPCLCLLCCCGCCFNVWKIVLRVWSPGSCLRSRTRTVVPKASQGVSLRGICIVSLHGQAKVRVAPSSIALFIPHRISAVRLILTIIEHQYRARREEFQLSKSHLVSLSAPKSRGGKSIQILYWSKSVDTCVKSTDSTPLLL